MKLNIPVLVTQQVVQNEQHYSARPLFHKDPEVSGLLLDRVLAKLAGNVRKELNLMAEGTRHDTLSNFCFDPNLYHRTFHIELQQKKRTVKGDFLVVVLPDHEPRVAFCPLLEGLWFQVERGSDLRGRTIEVLDHYFSRGHGVNLPAEWPQQCWLSQVEVPFKVPEQPPKTQKDINMMILGGPPVAQGWLELERVGRCLDDLYPHDLNPCLCRDHEVARLEHAFRSAKRAPQLILGPRKVGKTSLVHEMVRRHHKDQKKDVKGRRFWLLSPQRLISGMSYLGQWEARLLSILKYASDKNLVLIFDDLLGLFSAGVSRDSNLCVADVLKPYLQQQKVRILAECTPEGLSILRERDRGFADLFALHHLRETSQQDTLTIALEEIRSGERLHSCRFDSAAVLTAIDLQRRYIKDSVFPGKAAGFLRRLAARGRKADLTQDHVYDYFHSISGIDFQFLMDGWVLKRADVVAQLESQVMGQPQAVQAAADAVMMCKSRLCDPSRPVASLLFVGPTGVGKTECAKALARYLFRDEERLVRFDMNEFINPGSAARLVGTFHQPDGLLTSAIRRRPFCVLLLDELEKAHHEVFNLLLQVLGDGRLTDARGRTVDFTQAIIVMTSNLGVKEAGKTLGLRSKESEADLTYRRAVEQYFPPEFFNRLDRIVAFGRLSREVTKDLAGRILGKVLGREGLVRRQCILDVSSEATEKIVDMGYHPELGARALKRSIEQSISNPVSARLAAMRPLAPTIISIRANPDLEVSVTELAPAPVQTHALVSRFNQGRLEELARTFEALQEYLERQDPNQLIDEGVSSAQAWHYSLQDRLRRCRAIAGRLAGYLRVEAPPKRPVETAHSLLQAADWEGVLESTSLSQAMVELVDNLPSQSEARRLHSKVAELQTELAFLTPRGEDQTVSLELRFAPTAKDVAHKLAHYLKDGLVDLDLDCRLQLSAKSVKIELVGPRAEEVARSERGYHLFYHAQSLMVVEAVIEGEGESDSYHPLVLRVYNPDLGILDLRTGWFCREEPLPEEMAILIASALPTRLEVDLASL